MNNVNAQPQPQQPQQPQPFRKPRSSGMGYTVFWGLFCVSLYLNFHFALLQFTSSRGDKSQLGYYGHGWQYAHVLHPGNKDAFIAGASPLRTSQQYMQQEQQQQQQLQQQLSSLPCVHHNLTKDLEELVEFTSPEMLLKTAWQGLIKQRSKNTPYRIITNVVPRKRVKRKDYGAEDFSLSTHTTVARLDRLLEEYRRWDGPVSAAVYISSEEEIDAFLAFIHDKGRILKDIAIHVLMEDLSFMSKQYPNNILRNLAMSQLETDFFVALDVDFVTNAGAHGQLRQLLHNYPNLTELLRSKTLLVLPAFESESYEATVVNATGHPVIEKRAKTYEAPYDKKDLIQKVNQGIVAPFHLRQFPPGHGPTRFPIWFDNRTGPIYPIIYNKKYEPYVLAYRKGLPRYWTGFRGYFYNKYSWFVEVNAMGYKFAVLRDFFVFHVGVSGGSTKIPLWKSREWQKFLQYKDQIHGERIAPYFPGLNESEFLVEEEKILDDVNTTE